MTRTNSGQGALVCFAVLSILLGAIDLGAQEGPPSRSEIQQALDSPDSLVRSKVWQRLNPEDSFHYKVLVQILGKLDWHDRDAAAVALSKAGTDDTLEDMAKELKKNRNPFVRQGMASALARMNDEKFYPKLYEALNDRDPFVRRVVVDSLKVHKKEDAVEALIQRFQMEDDPVVNTFIIESLNSITQAYQGTNPINWLAWWNEAKHDKDYKLGKITDEEAKARAEELGRKLRTRKTVLAGVTLETAERGGESGLGVPILVLPYYNRSKETMLPFLAELEKDHKIYYIDLPEIKSFKGLKTIGATGLPYYPIDELVEAFEALRKDTGEERFALLTCGTNSWIGMRYASKYPESLAAMIFISPLSSNREFSNAVKRMVQTGQKKKDIELWHLGLSFTVNIETGESHHEVYHKENNIPKPDGEDQSLARRRWSLRFKDSRDSTLGLVFPKATRPIGGVLIPQFDLVREKKVKVPTLTIVGSGTMFTSVDDCKRVAKHYPGGKLLVYKNSACMPFVEEGSRFNKEVGAFLMRYARYKNPKQRKKDAN